MYICLIKACMRSIITKVKKGTFVAKIIETPIVSRDKL